jgi:protocatechuate 3,4-dioxygenase beta subunit
MVAAENCLAVVRVDGNDKKKARRPAKVLRERGVKSEQVRSARDACLSTDNLAIDQGGVMPKFALSILVLLFAFLSVQAQLTDMGGGTGIVSGRVTLKGEPARGVVVLLQSEEAKGTGDRNQGLRVKTDENGRFRFTGLKAGQYTLTALAHGFITHNENTFGSRTKTINISDGENIENHEIALKRGAVITGRVTDSGGKPLVEQQVEVTTIDDQGQPMRRYMSVTDDRGIYRLYALPAGRYLVSAGLGQRESSMVLTTNRTYYQRTFHHDTTEESKAEVVEVSEGFEATGIDIKVASPKRTYDVFGRVENTDTGQPVASVRMALGSLTDGGKRIGAVESFGNQTDAQGEFNLQSVLPGKYAIFASSEQESDFYSEPTPFEIGDEDVTGLVVKVRRGGSISGVAVIEGTNDPAILSKFSQIEIYTYLGSEELSAQTNSPAKLSPDGSFVIKGVRPGVVRFAILYRSEAKFWILNIEHNGASRLEGIQINAGEQVTGIRLVIGHGSNVVRGQLRVIGGALPEGTILIVKANRAGTEIVNGRSGPVDPSGQFVIEGLPPGEYELKLSISFRFGNLPNTDKLVERLSKQTQAVTVGGNQETHVTFAVDLAPKEGGQ